MKGSSIITFAIIMSLAFAIIFFISMAAYSYYKNAKESLRQQQARQVAYQLISEIEKIYLVGSKLNSNQTNQSITLLEKNISLPEKIAGSYYYVEAISSSGLWSSIEANETIKEEHSSNKIGIVFDDEKFYFNLPNMPIVFEGKANPGNVKISYKKYMFGDAVKDAIVIGDSDFIIDIDSLE